MYEPREVACSFFECFDKSALSLFRNFVQRHSNATKWLISADFCLHDTSRPKDIFAFTILPYDALPQDFAEEVQEAVPCDLKKAKELGQEGITWLKSSRHFHIVFEAARSREPFSNSSEETPLQVARDHLNKTVNLLEASTRSRPETLKRFKQLQQKALAKSFNTMLLGDIWLMSLLFATLTIAIGRERESEMIGWFPDRDNMTSFCGGVWQDYAFGNLGVIADAMSTDITVTKIMFAMPDTSSGKEVMWFDHIIRSSDWFAGALAAWDRDANTLPGEHAKYKQMLEDVIADAPNVLIFGLDWESSGLAFKRVVVSAAEGA